MNASTPWISCYVMTGFALWAMSDVQANEPLGFAETNPANCVPDVRWPAPTLTDQNFTAWQKFIQPGPDELKWRRIRWHTSLAPAIQEAHRLQRPILLWTMNGNPCGET